MYQRNSHSHSLTHSLSLYLSIDLAIHLSIYLSSYLLSSTRLSIHQSICPSIHRAVYLSLSPPLRVSFLAIHPSIYLPIYLFIYLHIYLSVYLSAYLLIYLSTYLALMFVYLFSPNITDQGGLSPICELVAGTLPAKHSKRTPWTPPNSGKSGPDGTPPPDPYSLTTLAKSNLPACPAGFRNLHLEVHHYEMPYYTNHRICHNFSKTDKYIKGITAISTVPSLFFGSATTQSATALLLQQCGAVLCGRCQQLRGAQGVQLRAQLLQLFLREVLASRETF